MSDFELSDNDSIIPSDDEEDNDNTIIKKGIKIGTFEEDDDEEDGNNDDDDNDEDLDDDVDDAENDNEVEDDDEYEGGGESDQDMEIGEDDENDEDDENESENVIVKKKPKKIVQPTLLESDEDDDDEDMEDNFLQKFNTDVNKNYVHEFHPECIIHNYDEISASTKVVRDTNNIIIDPLHRTIPFLTKYEKARILGQRAKQIEAGAKPFVSVPEHIIDSYIIAELELQQKKIPFIIRRPIPGGGFEYWSLKDLEVIAF